MLENILCIVIILFAVAVTYVAFRALRVWIADDLRKRNQWLFGFLIGVCLIAGGTIFLLRWHSFTPDTYRGQPIENLTAG
jgi:hypothetical protein